MNEQVRDFYNQHYQEEDLRLNYHAFEVPITLYYIKKYLKPGSKILDLACGTGHYAERFIKEGYLVALNDLSDQNIQLVRERFSDVDQVLAIDQSAAIDTELWDLAKWDAVMMLGPLYHYYDVSRRKKLLNKANEKLKIGGLIYSAFMSRTGGLIFGMKHNPEGIFSQNGSKQLWEEGIGKHFVEDTDTFKNAHVYFSDPAEIYPLIKSTGFRQQHLVGIEGIFGERFDDYHRMDPSQKVAWLEFVQKHAEEPAMIYNSKHLLSVASKM